MQVRGRQRLAGDLLERDGESRQRRLVDRQPGGKCVAAEPAHEPWRALGHEIEPVAQVETGDRAAGTPELAAGASREDDGRPVVAILQPRRDNADDALMPFGSIHAKRERVGIGRSLDRCQIGQRFVPHRSLDFATLAVQRVELRGQRRGLVGRAREQAANAERHVGQPAGGIQTRSGDEAQIEPRRARDIAPRHVEDRSQTGMRAPAANARQPLRDQNAVHEIEPHDVGDGAERDEIEQCAEVRLARLDERTALTQTRPQRGQHEEHHADAGNVLRRIRAAGLIRIDDDRLGKRRARQVVIGDENVDAARFRGCNAFDAADAVVHRDDQLRAAVRGKRDDFGRQPITELEAIRYDEIRLRTERAQTLERNRAGGRAVCVVIGDDDDAFTAVDCGDQAIDGGVDVGERGEARQRVEPAFEIVHRRDSARRIDAREHRRNAAVQQCLNMRWNRAPNDRNRHSSTGAGISSERLRNRDVTRASPDGRLARHVTAAP